MSSRGQRISDDIISGVIDDDGFRRMQARLADLLPRLNERDRRLALATEAKSWGRGGISAVQRATGASRSTIRRGITELEGDDHVGSPRVRRPGGGRKKAEVTNPELLENLDSLIEPETRGDPESPLRWTTKSTRHLARALTTMGTAISHSAVAAILRERVLPAVEPADGRAVEVSDVGDVSRPRRVVPDGA